MRTTGPLPVRKVKTVHAAAARPLEEDTESVMLYAFPRPSAPRRRIGCTAAVPKAAGRPAGERHALTPGVSGAHAQEKVRGEARSSGSTELDPSSSAVEASPTTALPPLMTAKRGDLRARFNTG